MNKEEKLLSHIAMQESIYYKKGYIDALREVIAMAKAEDYFMGIDTFRDILIEHLKGVEDDGH